MKDSIIYDLLEKELLRKWKDEIAKDKDDAFYFADAEERFDALAATLDDKQKKLLNLFSAAQEDKYENLFYNLSIKLLNFGIKIGMDLEKSFTNFEY